MYKSIDQTGIGLFLDTIELALLDLNEGFGNDRVELSRPYDHDEQVHSPVVTSFKLSCSCRPIFAPMVLVHAWLYTPDLSLSGNAGMHAIFLDVSLRTPFSCLQRLTGFLLITILSSSIPRPFIMASCLDPPPMGYVCSAHWLDSRV